MRKVIGAINMTLDGYCDHTAITAGDEIHRHYTELLKHSDTILYGRKTFELMEFWRTFIDHPSGDESMDEFAIVMNGIHKVVFSGTLKNIDWESAELSQYSLEEEVQNMVLSSGSDILVGSRSLIIQLLQLKLLEELQLCLHPVVAGGELELFEEIKERLEFELIDLKALKSGGVIQYLRPVYQR